jgi:hypothetical protein
MRAAAVPTTSFRPRRTEPFSFTATRRRPSRRVEVCGLEGSLPGRPPRTREVPAELVEPADRGTPLCESRSSAPVERPAQAGDSLVASTSSPTAGEVPLAATTRSSSGGPR